MGALLSLLEYYRSVCAQSGIALQELPRSMSCLDGGWGNPEFSSKWRTRRTNTRNRDWHYDGLTKVSTRTSSSLFTSLGRFLLPLPLLRLQPLKKSFARSDNPVPLHVTLEELRIGLDLSLHPLDVRLCLGALHLGLREFRTSRPLTAATL
jgi:hypothetical protein